jgi:hypothetical protein
MSDDDRGDDFVASNEALDEPEAPAAAPAAVEAEKPEAPESESPRDDKGRFIPQDRHKVILEGERGRRETAERQVAELQAQMAQISRQVDVGELDRQLAELRAADRKAIMAGDEQASVALGAEMDRLNRQIMIQQATEMSLQAKDEAREEIRVDLAIEKLEEAYPQLAEGHEAFDQELVNYVLAEQRRLISEARMAPSKALTKAASDIMRRLSPAAAADAAGAKGLGAATKGVAPLGAERTAKAAKSAVDAALRTPPSTEGVGIDSDKAGMRDGMPVPMSVEDLAALPDATLKRMRGDVL